MFVNAATKIDLASYDLNSELVDSLTSHMRLYGALSAGEAERIIGEQPLDVQAAYLYQARALYEILTSQISPINQCPRKPTSQLKAKFQKIKPAPGGKVESIFKSLHSKKSYENTIEQMIGDFREEYFELLHRHGGVTPRMRYLEALLALNCTWCTLRLLVEKLLFIDKILQRITK